MKNVNYYILDSNKKYNIGKSSLFFSEVGPIIIPIYMNNENKVKRLNIIFQGQTSNTIRN